ncbi:uncharacterized protein LOC116855884 isoform X2 [Lontra canadensis]|uniref:uncharacterized protein LOC116855884 isoform X2 n=1 Tax=Lontra canadensis TaxID=76717 RepID=UPI0013F399D0|nr:uncharacterized protein LOC116855884 isoform X2 [Lontra canadensis]
MGSLAGVEFGLDFAGVALQQQQWKLAAIWNHPHLTDKKIKFQRDAALLLPTSLCLVLGAQLRTTPGLGHHWWGTKQDAAWQAELVPPQEARPSLAHLHRTTTYDTGFPFPHLPAPNLACGSTSERAETSKLHLPDVSEAAHPLHPPCNCLLLQVSTSSLPYLAPSVTLIKGTYNLVTCSAYLKLLHDSLPTTTWPSRPYVPWPQLNFLLYVFY